MSHDTTMKNDILKNKCDDVLGAMRLKTPLAFKGFPSYATFQPPLSDMEGGTGDIPTFDRQHWIPVPTSTRLDRQALKAKHHFVADPEWSPPVQSRHQRVPRPRSRGVKLRSVEAIVSDNQRQKALSTEDKAGYMTARTPPRQQLPAQKPPPPPPPKSKMIDFLNEIKAAGRTSQSNSPSAKPNNLTPTSTVATPNGNKKLHQQPSPNKRPMDQQVFKKPSHLSTTTATPPPQLPPTTSSATVTAPSATTAATVATPRSSRQTGTERASTKTDSVSKSRPRSSDTNLDLFLTKQFLINDASDPAATRHIEDLARWDVIKKRPILRVRLVLKKQSNDIKPKINTVKKSKNDTKSDAKYSLPTGTIPTEFIRSMKIRKKSKSDQLSTPPPPPPPLTTQTPPPPPPLPVASSKSSKAHMMELEEGETISPSPSPRRPSTTSSSEIIKPVPPPPPHAPTSSSSLSISATTSSSKRPRDFREKDVPLDEPVKRKVPRKETAPSSLSSSSSSSSSSPASSSTSSSKYVTNDTEEQRQRPSSLPQQTHHATVGSKSTARKEKQYSHEEERKALPSNTTGKRQERSISGSSLEDNNNSSRVSREEESTKYRSAQKLSSSSSSSSTILSSSRRRRSSRSRSRSRSPLRRSSSSSSNTGASSSLERSRRHTPTIAVSSSSSNTKDHKSGKEKVLSVQSADSATKEVIKGTSTMSSPANVKETVKGSGSVPSSSAASNSISKSSVFDKKRYRPATAENAETPDQYRVFSMMFQKLAFAYKRRGDNAQTEIATVLDHMQALLNYIMAFHYQDKLGNDFSQKNWETLHPFTEVLLKRLRLRKDKERKDALLYGICLRIKALVYFYTFSRKEMIAHSKIARLCENGLDDNKRVDYSKSVERVFLDHEMAYSALRESDKYLAFDVLQSKFPDTYLHVCVLGQLGPGIVVGGEAGTSVGPMYPLVPYSRLHHAAIMAKCLLQEYVIKEHVNYRTITETEDYM